MLGRVVALVLALACPVPAAAQVAAGRAVVQGAAAVAAPGDRIDALSRRPDGLLRRIAGALRVPAADDAARLVAFRARYGAAFGDGPALELAVARADGPDARRIVRAEQTVHGFPLAGHGLVLRCDGDVVRAAHGVLHAGAPATPPPGLWPDEAIDLALRGAGLAPAALSAPPLVRRVGYVGGVGTGAGSALPGGVQLVYRVEAVLGLIPWALEVSAHDGRLLRVVENTVHGGTFVFDGASLPFATGPAKARYYRKVAHAEAAVAKGGKLSEVIAEDLLPGLADTGTLTGRYAHVLDALGFQLFLPGLDFTFDHLSPAPFGGVPEHQLFDHANAYHWLTRMGGFLGQRLGPFAGDVSTPAYVNYDDGGDGYVNAFYSTADLDGPGGYAPGYFLFGEFSGLTGDPMDDLSRDPSVVCHEYTHMVVFREGHTFGAADADTPPRAMNEALADYAAASFLRDPLVGRAFASNSGDDLGLGAAALRDLTREATLDADLWDVVGQTGLPEEHEAGVIFGAALWRARAALSPVVADEAILGGLADWPLGTAEVGFPTVTPGNATAAYRAYFSACLDALADALLEQGGKGAPRAAAVLGAALAHGLSGTGNGDVRELDLGSGGSLSVPSAFLDGQAGHLVDVALEPGQVLSISVRGRKGTAVDFDFDDEPGDFTPSKPKKQNAAGTAASWTKIAVNTGRTYRLTVSNPDGEGGDYVLVLKAK